MLKEDPNKEINEIFLNYCTIGNLDSIKDLLTNPNFKDKIDIHYKDDDGFTNACANGHIHLVKYFLTSSEIKKKRDFSQYLDLGFVFACESGYLPLMKYLLISNDLKKHANVHTYNSYVFLHAAKFGNLEILDFLISFKKISEELKEILFIEASKNKQYHITKYFIFNLDMKMNKITKKEFELLNEDIIEVITEQFKKRKLFFNLIKNLKVKNKEEEIKKV